MHVDGEQLRDDGLSNVPAVMPIGLVPFVNFAVIRAFGTLDRHRHGCCVRGFLCHLLAAPSARGRLARSLLARCCLRVFRALGRGPSWKQGFAAVFMMIQSELGATFLLDASDILTYGEFACTFDLRAPLAEAELDVWDGPLAQISDTFYANFHRDDYFPNS